MLACCTSSPSPPCYLHSSWIQFHFSLHIFLKSLLRYSFIIIIIIILLAFVSSLVRSSEVLCVNLFDSRSSSWTCRENHKLVILHSSSY